MGMGMFMVSFASLTLIFEPRPMSKPITPKALPPTYLALTRTPLNQSPCATRALQESCSKPTYSELD